MNPMLKRFAVYSSFNKYDYREVSKPDQTFIEKLKNFKLIFFDFRYKTSYVKDLKSLKEKFTDQVPRANSLKLYYRMYKLSEVLIGVYCIHSFYWHYKKGYFQTKSKITEFYILGKIIFSLVGLAAISFFALKSWSDPIMYEYFKVKEEEWEKIIESRKAENETIKEFVKKKEEKFLNKDK